MLFFSPPPLTQGGHTKEEEEKKKSRITRESAGRFGRDLEETLKFAFFACLRLSISLQTKKQKYIFEQHFALFLWWKNEQHSALFDSRKLGSTPPCFMLQKRAALRLVFGNKIGLYPPGGMA